jgi:hypothetical protein
MFYKTKETKTEEKAHISKHKSGQLDKEGKNHNIYLQQEQTFY